MRRTADLELYDALKISNVNAESTYNVSGLAPKWCHSQSHRWNVASNQAKTQKDLYTNHDYLQGLQVGRAGDVKPQATAAAAMASRDV